MKKASRFFPFLLLNTSHLQKKIVSIFLTLLVLFYCSTSSALATSNYLYDANGNMTSDGQYCYTYNDANQLATVKNCSTSQLIAQYIYDGTGERIEKKEYTNGVLSQTIYNPEKDYETIKLASNSATQNSTYYFANNQIIAKKNPDGTKLFYQNDHLGSANLLTDANGSIVENTTYDPFGQVLTGGTKSKYQYTGQEKDQETPLNYYNARYYDSQIQHFTQPDTIIPDLYNPQTLNRYSYVQNNPLRYIDPSGHAGADPTFDMVGPDWTDGISVLMDPNYVNTSNFKNEQRERMNITYSLSKMSSKIIPYLPIPAAGIAGNASDSLLSGIDETVNVDKALDTGISNDQLNGIFAKAFGHFTQNYLNGQIADFAFPDTNSKSLSKIVKQYIGNQGTEKIAEKVENGSRVQQAIAAESTYFNNVNAVVQQLQPIQIPQNLPGTSNVQFHYNNYNVVGSGGLTGQNYY